MGALLLLAFAPAARALDLSDAEVAASAGFEGVVNDPFLHRRGLRLGASLAPQPWVEAGANLVWYPILGHGGESDPDWKPLTKQLLLENNVSPDISKITWQGQAVLRVHAFRADLDDWQSSVGLLGGAALVRTADDLVALQACDNSGCSEEAVATESQVHPGLVGGAFWEARLDGFSVRVRYESLSYIETINSTTLEHKNNAIFGAEVMLWLR